MKRSTVATLLGITLLGGALTGCASGADSRQPAPSVSAPPGTTPGTTGDTDAPSGNAGAACGQQTAPHPELAGQLPAGFPTLPGWQPTEATEQGRTRAVRGVLPGEPADLTTVRNRAVDQLTGAGYRRTGADEETGFEAEAELEGPYEVNLNVKPLCRGYLVLSYLVRQ